VRAALPTLDAVFSTLGQPGSAEPPTAVVRTALRAAAVDAAVSDSLRALQLDRERQTRADDSEQRAVSLAKDIESKRELMFGVELEHRSIAAATQNPTAQRWAGQWA
jgi:hypothetical protein